MDDVRVVPLVVGALGGLTGVSLSHFVLALAGTQRIERAQQCAILGTLNIVKSVLGIRHQVPHVTGRASPYKPPIPHLL